MRARASVIAIAASLLSFGGAGATTATPARAEVRIFAFGGTPVSNGVFSPGTILQVGGQSYGEPYSVAQGSDVRFTNLDLEQAANSHCMVSIKRSKRTRTPLFASQCIKGPSDTLVVTSHLKPGVYEFFCPIHFGMLGALEVTG